MTQVQFLSRVPKKVYMIELMNALDCSIKTSKAMQTIDGKLLADFLSKVANSIESAAEDGRHEIIIKAPKNIDVQKIEMMLNFKGYRVSWVRPKYDLWFEISWR